MAGRGASPRPECATGRFSARLSRQDGTTSPKPPALSGRTCCAKTVIVRQGLNSLNEAEEEEEDLLDRAWGLEPQSRLSCQAILAQTDVTVEIPKYTINHAKENH